MSDSTDILPRRSSRESSVIALPAINAYDGKENVL